MGKKNVSRHFWLELFNVMRDSIEYIEVCEGRSMQIWSWIFKIRNGGSNMAEKNNEKGWNLDNTDDT